MKTKARKSQSPQLRAVGALLNDLKAQCQWAIGAGHGHKYIHDGDAQADAELSTFLEEREKLMTMRDKLRAKEGLSKLKDDGMVPLWVAEALDRAESKAKKKPPPR